MLIGSDDFGYNPDVNTSVLKGLRQAQFGFVSVMVSMPGSTGALAAIGDYPTQFGLHLNLTEGRPLLAASEVPTLVNMDGELLGWPGLIRRAMLGRLNPTEVQREAEAQLKRFQSHRPQIDFLNSHHHVHLFPSIARVLEPLIAQYQIPAIRSPRAVWWHNLAIGYRTKALTIQTLGTLHRSQARRLGDYLFDLDWCGPSDAARAQLLQTLPDTTELACHPLTASFAWILANAPSYTSR